MKHIKKVSKPALAGSFSDFENLFCLIFSGVCEDKCKGPDFIEIGDFCIHL